MPRGRLALRHPSHTAPRSAASSSRRRRAYTMRNRSAAGVTRFELLARELEQQIAVGVAPGRSLAAGAPSLCDTGREPEPGIPGLLASRISVWRSASAKRRTARGRRFSGRDLPHQDTVRCVSPNIPVIAGHDQNVEWPAVERRLADGRIVAEHRLAVATPSLGCRVSSPSAVAEQSGAGQHGEVLGVSTFECRRARCEGEPQQIELRRAKWR